MVEIQILNSPEIDQWIWDQTQKGHCCRAIKGKLPDGIKYVDGDFISDEINVAFEVATGERIDVKLKSIVNEKEWNPTVNGTGPLTGNY